jgi:hypothetical protein
MQRCTRCGRPIARDDAGRRQWCRDIRSLFILTDIQPEDYHPNCFLNALIDDPTKPHPDAGPAEPNIEPQLATADSQSPGGW